MNNLINFIYFETNLKTPITPLNNNDIHTTEEEQASALGDYLNTKFTPKIQSDQITKINRTQTYIAIPSTTPAPLTADKTEKEIQRLIHKLPNNKPPATMTSLANS